MAPAQICQRYSWRMDRDQHPDEWISEDDNKENQIADEQAQTEKWKRCVGSFMIPLYARNKEICIVYENIVANIIGVATRSGLHDELEKIHQILVVRMMAPLQYQCQ